MELDIGMSREGLRKLANDIIASLDETHDVEIVRYVQPNGRGGELVLTFNNDDMDDREDITEDTAFWEMQQ